MIPASLPYLRSKYCDTIKNMIKIEQGIKLFVLTDAGGYRIRLGFIVCKRRRADDTRIIALLAKQVL